MRTATRALPALREASKRQLQHLRAMGPDELWARVRWLPVAAAALYLLAIVVHLPRILDSVWLSSDSDIDGVLAHLSISAPSGTLLTTGNFPHYETMAFTLLTRSWPFYRELWMIAPVLFAAVGLVAVVASTWLAFGRWPAAITGSVLVCLSGGGEARLTSGGLGVVFAIDAHANTLITAAVCGLALVWVLPRIAQLSVRRLVAMALAIALLGGLPLAGDKLYLAWGLTPLLVVTVLCAWRGPLANVRRTLSFGICTAATSGVVSVLFAAVMRHAGVRGNTTAYNGFLTFVKSADVPTNFETLIRGLPSLTAGTFFGKALSLRSELEAVSALLVFTALVTVIWTVRQRVAASAPRAARGGAPADARFVHNTYWTTVLLAGLLLFMIGSPDPSSTDGRYLLGPYVAIAALLPLLLARGTGWKLLVTGSATVFVISALWQFNDGVLRQMQAGYTPRSTAQQLAVYARREQVAVGYGYYWNSVDLIWNSDFKLRVYPVQQCSQELARLCKFNAISMSDWERPHGDVRSMLVVYAKDVRAPLRLGGFATKGRIRRDNPLTPANLAGAFGTPVAVTRIGTLIIYVYGYDIETRLLREVEPSS